LDIARQVQGDTQSNRPLGDLQAEIQTMLDAWKAVTYPQAWAYMEQCQRAPHDPGYLINPWGRMRRFAKTEDRNLLQQWGREAMNFPEMYGEVKRGEFEEYPTSRTTTSQ
jgi:hypothetical protein